MQGQGFYDENNCLVYPDEVGAFCGDSKPVQRVAGSPGTRTPITRTRVPITSRFRKIGNPSPGVLGDIQTWWAGIPKEWRWGVLGGIGVLAVITAALGKKEGKSKVEKV